MPCAQNAHTMPFTLALMVCVAKQTRAAALKKIVAAYPNAARRDSQQVVDVRKDNEKFMSPMSQLVGAESEVIDIRERLQAGSRN